MELWSTKNERFRKEANEIIKLNGEILIMVRYAYSAGSKDFFIIDSEEEFSVFLEARKPKDSITIFKTFENLTEGVVNEDFINKTLNTLVKPKSSDWIVIFPKIIDKWGNPDWSFEETKEELEEILQDQIVDYVRILEEPDWLNEELVFHAYVPDEDGEVRPGSY